ncbi:MAG: ADP-forming succinate--CoA ligase subunit beta [bacterium]|nr:ADP-forming succinate--CoA ligase subunit beta [bacterium]
MNIHEHQAKELLRAHGVETVQGAAAFAPEEAVAAARNIGGDLWVVKAQIHAGGRGKAGGVKLAHSLEEVEQIAKELLGKTLVTHQTGPEGQLVRRLFVEAGCAIEKEFYASFVVDRAAGAVTAVISPEGGVDIEDVAANSPEKILKVVIDPVTGFQGFHGRKMAFFLGLSGKQVSKAVKLLKGLYDAFTRLDAEMIEVNPLVLTKEGDLVALDAKMSFDENALYRHPEVEALRDEAEENPVELEAARQELNYIQLDGSIGCMVNGAGLAMATMDVIKLYGSEPANFLDVGGGAPKERVIAAFKIILSDPNVKGILVNIFGGIMRCDVIAEGIIAAAKDVSLHVPLVVRLEGTKVEEGKRILEQSGLTITSATDLGDAAQKVVQAVKEAA